MAAAPLTARATAGSRALAMSPPRNLMSAMSPPLRSSVGSPSVPIAPLGFHPSGGSLPPGTMSPLVARPHFMGPQRASTAVTSMPPQMFAHMIMERSPSPLRQNTSPAPNIYRPASSAAPVGPGPLPFASGGLLPLLDPSRSLAELAALGGSEFSPRDSVWKRYFCNNQKEAKNIYPPKPRLSGWHSPPPATGDGLLRPAEQVASATPAPSGFELSSPLLQDPANGAPRLKPPQARSPLPKEGLDVPSAPTLSSHGSNWGGTSGPPSETTAAATAGLQHSQLSSLNGSGSVGHSAPSAPALALEQELPNASSAMPGGPPSPVQDLTGTEEEVPSASGSQAASLQAPSQVPSQAPSQQPQERSQKLPKGGSNAGLLKAVTTCAEAISAEDLVEIRALNPPHPAVKEVVETTLMLLGFRDPSWAASRGRFEQPDSFLEKLLAFDASRSISRVQYQKLKRSLEAPKGAFTGGQAEAKCPAVGGLERWCRAVGDLLMWRYGDLPAAAADAKQGSKVLAKPGQTQGKTAGQKSARPALGNLVVIPDIYSMSAAELRSVSDLTIRKPNVGEVTFHGEIDLVKESNILEELPYVVRLDPGEVVLYPAPESKPVEGEGLNRPATITLYQCLPPNSGTFPDADSKMRYRERIAQMTESKGARFVDYDCDRGIWQFRVEHF